MTSYQQMTAYRALSIRQPWAGLILAGVKDVENRTWSTQRRGPLIIHAGTQRDTAAVDLAAQYGVTDCPRGGYLGVAELVDVHHDHDCRGDCSPWAEPGAWHWALARPQAFPKPVPGRGHLGLYTPPAPVIATAQLATARKDSA